MDWFYSNLVGGVRLQVDAADAAAAAEVLDQPVPEAIPFGEKEEFVQPRCPRCGSVDISFLGSDRRAALASVTLVGVPLPLGNGAGSAMHAERAGRTRVMMRERPAWKRNDRRMTGWTLASIHEKGQV